MKRIFIILLVVTFCKNFAQNLSNSVLNTGIDKYPEYYGGSLEFKRFLDYHQLYPEKALKEKKEGKVVIHFLVTRKGEVIDPVVVERVDPEIDKEAMRLFKLLLWTPAVKYGAELDLEQSLTIPFKISKYKKSLKLRGDISSELPKKEADTSLIIYGKADKPAAYLYGNDSLRKYIIANMQYPGTAKQLNMEGTVKLSFVVETNGFISNIKIEKGVGGGCNEEAIRIMGETKWSPAEINGKLVRYKLAFPVTFNLSTNFHNNSSSEQRE